MRIAVVADTHVANHKRWGGDIMGGLNRRAREAITTLTAASQGAAKLGADALVVCGDLFDNVRPTPQLVAATATALRVGSMHAFILVGNHDLASSQDNDHACASLKQIDGITVVDKPLLKQGSGVQLLLVPYSAGVASEWLPAGISKLVSGPAHSSEHRLLFTHVGIWDESTPAYMKATKDSVGIGQVRWLCEAHSIGQTFAGNWHQFTRWPRSDSYKFEVCIPGTLIPHNFNDRLDVGSMMLVNTATGQVSKHAIPGPRFETLEGLSRLTEWAGSVQAVREKQVDHGYYWYGRVRVRSDQLQQALEMKSVVERGGHHLLVEVGSEQQDEMAKEIRRIAVTTSDTALRDYAAVTDVKEPGTRDGLIKRLESYRKEAGA